MKPEQSHKLQKMIRKLPAEMQSVMDIVYMAMNSRDKESSGLFRDIKLQIKELSEKLDRISAEHRKDMLALESRIQKNEHWQNKVMWSLIFSLFSIVGALISVIYFSLV